MLAQSCSSIFSHWRYHILFLSRLMPAHRPSLMQEHCPSTTRLGIENESVPPSRFSKILDLPFSLCVFDVAWSVTLYLILENKVELSFFQVLFDVFSESLQTHIPNRLRSHWLYTYCKSISTVRITDNQDKNLSVTFKDSLERRDRPCFSCYVELQKQRIERHKWQKK